MIKLYDYLPCPYGQKVRIALAEKSLNYELIEVDVTRGANRRPEFIRLNPFGRVPVLIDDETTVYDSTIVIEYLEDEYPEPPLLPALNSSALRARARQFEDFADTSFTPQVGQLMAEQAKAEAERDPTRIQRVQRGLENILNYINRELEGQEFLAGPFSVADIAFAPRLLVLKEMGFEAAFNRPHVEGWIKRLSERAAIANLKGLSVEPLPGAA
ncbi:MAG: glutathione S-transferase family protein [Deltaproteobacteria bacterium]|jgi:glutathione S-transferase|nr:glutathione S-transferase family protein [Deltaproteobacteria bacterium]